MCRAAVAGLVYFAIVFAVAVALGIARAALLAPWVGELAAVAIELPVVLAADRLRRMAGQALNLGSSVPEGEFPCAGSKPLVDWLDAVLGGPGQPMGSSGLGSAGTAVARPR